VACRSIIDIAWSVGSLWDGRSAVLSMPLKFSAGLSPVVSSVMISEKPSFVVSKALQ
jgi:hypothetical protein